MKASQLYRPKVLNTLKVVLILTTLGFIFYKLFYAYDLDKLAASFNFEFTRSRCFMLAGALFLMVCNWVLETFKWRLLISKYEDISFNDSLKAIVSGIALGLISPNQIGDFAGRIIHLKKFDKIKGTLVTVIGNTAQVIMTIAFGLFAFIWLCVQREILSGNVSVYLFAISFILVVAGLAGYLHIHFVKRLSSSPKFTPYLDVFGAYSKTELTYVLIFAFLRYLIFVAQYLLLLNFFEIDLPFLTAVCCIIATLFAQAFVPSFLLIQIGMRGASALFFFTVFTSNSVGILLSAYSLWIINLMVPALCGLWVILKLRLTK